MSGIISADFMLRRFRIALADYHGSDNIRVNSSDLNGKSSEGKLLLTDHSHSHNTAPQKSLIYFFRSPPIFNIRDFAWENFKYRILSDFNFKGKANSWPNPHLAKANFKTL